MIEANLLAQNDKNLEETLSPQAVLPTRNFIVQLPGFKIKVPEPYVSRNGMIRTIYPNWVGSSEINGSAARVEIRAYSALTRLSFKGGDSSEDWLLNEEGGRGFTLQLYGNGVSTESIVNSYYHGADFYARVPYKERKAISYTWKFPKPDHVFPVITMEDIDLESELSTNASQALYLMERFKQLLDTALVDATASDTRIKSSDIV